MDAAPTEGRQGIGRRLFPLVVEEVAGVIWWNALKDAERTALHDFAAKIISDNLQSLATQAALRQTPLSATRRVNRATAHSLLKPLWSTLLLGADIATRLRGLLQLSVGRTYLTTADIIKSKPRVAQPKPHKSMSHKPC